MRPGPAPSAGKVAATQDNPKGKDRAQRAVPLREKCEDRRGDHRETMHKQIPRAAESAGFGMPILRGIGICNRNTPELKPGLSRLRLTVTPVLIATLFWGGGKQESTIRHMGKCRSLVAQTAGSLGMTH